MPLNEVEYANLDHFAPATLRCCQHHYPYHYGETDPARLTELLPTVAGVEGRIREFQ
jgi:hypothetical protein